VGIRCWCCWGWVLLAVVITECLLGGSGGLRTLASLAIMILSKFGNQLVGVDFADDGSVPMSCSLQLLRLSSLGTFGVIWRRSGYQSSRN